MQENINSGQACEICGGTGNDILIAVCSICHKSREHIYCMRRNLEEVPESWECEACHAETPQDSCKSQKTLVNDSTKVSDANERISHKIARRVLSRSFVPKKVETGKVRYLALNEIYSHPPRANPKLSFFPVKPRSQPRSFVSHHRRIPNKMSVPTSPKYLLNKEHACKSSTQPTAQPVSRVQTSTLPKMSVKPIQPLSGLKKSPSKSSTSEDLKSAVALTKRGKSHFSNGVHCSSNDHIGPVTNSVQRKRLFEETPSKMDNRTEKVNSVSTKDNLSKKEPLNAAVPCDKSGRSTLKFKFGEEDFPNPPAAIASWKGSFETLNFPHRVDVQAYPPGKVSRKAYLVSKQMPELLMFTLQPRCDVWPSLFNIFSPSGFDIALYFWAGNFSREKYNHLVELMDKEDLSMRTRLNDTELLVFTSRHLPVEAQRMSKQFYLWGVFQWKSSVDLEENKHADHFPSIESRITADSSAVTLQDDDHSSDMEIDMVGGIEVGNACSNSSIIPSHDVFDGAFSPQPLKQIATPTHLHPVKTEHFDGYDAPPGILGPVLAPYESDAPPGILRPVHSPGLEAPPGILRPIPSPYESKPPPGILRSVHSHGLETPPGVLRPIRAPYESKPPPGILRPVHSPALEAPPGILRPLRAPYESKPHLGILRPVHSPGLDAPPGFYRLRESSAKTDSLATISTVKKEGAAPKNSVPPSQKNHDDSGSKVDEVMHGARFQTYGDSKGKSKLQQDEKRVYIEQKKRFPRTPTKGVIIKDTTTRSWCER